MRHLPLLAAVLLVLPRPTAAQVEPGVYRHAVVHGEDARAVLLLVPEREQEEIPLAVLLHTEGSDGATFGRARQRFVDEATGRGWAVAIPYGAPCRDGDGLCWASRDDPPELAASEADDVGVLRALVADLDRLIDVDTERVFWAGHGEGGGMVHRMAAEAPELVAAGAIVAGLVGRETDPASASWSMLDLPETPVSMLVVHGIEDRVLPYGGYQRGSTGITPLPAVYAANAWGFDANGCDHAGVETHGFTGIGNRLSAPYGTMDYRAGCRAGTSVRFVAVGDHGHAWPEQGDAYDADREVVAFFEAQASSAGPR